MLKIKIEEEFDKSFGDESLNWGKQNKDNIINFALNCIRKVDKKFELTVHFIEEDIQDRILTNFNILPRTGERLMPEVFSENDFTKDELFRLEDDLWVVANVDYDDMENGLKVSIMLEANSKYDHNKRNCRELYPCS